MDLSYYSPGTFFCFHSEKKPPVANYSFSIPDGGGGGGGRGGRDEKSGIKCNKNILTLCIP